MRRATLPILLLLLAATASGQDAPFRIRVVDRATGRGVPLVELETVHNVLYVTDSAGVAAIDEPSLSGQEVWFHVRSHGYELAPDGFGFRGIRPVLVPGGSITVELDRRNVAERLYRVTGDGIYRDSLRLGDDVPIRRPAPAGGVLGQDSVQTALYRGRLHWFWGDTNRAAYPLGNFAVSGATSLLPADGGLDPSAGVDLEYFVDAAGFSRKMCPIDGPGPVWIDGLLVLEEGGRERMVAHYARVKSLAERYEHGLAVWDDDAGRFEKRTEWPLDAPLEPHGHAVRVEAGGEVWFHFTNPFPMVRVRARLDDLLDPRRYEAFTCLVAGSRWDEDRPRLDRDAGGRLRWAWKADTAAVTPERFGALVEAKRCAPEEGRFHLVDVESGRPVRGHGGSVAWNPHRRRWVMIALEAFGRSMLGEVWYAEADDILGPWGYARRIVTHDRYSFYNVRHHPWLDAEGGRRIHFEGTYTTLFSGNERPTPRYDYNQVMYRLDLDDERTCLPVAFDGFFALPPDRPIAGSVPVRPGDSVAFHVLPASRPAGDPHVALYEYRRGDLVRHATGEAPPGPGWERSEHPIGLAWRDPAR